MPLSDEQYEQAKSKFEENAKSVDEEDVRYAASKGKSQR